MDDIPLQLSVFFHVGQVMTKLSFVAPPWKYACIHAIAVLVRTPKERQGCEETLARVVVVMID